MRPTALRLLLPLALIAPLDAADPAADFTKAMASNDSVAKKAAVSELDALPDDEALPLLVSAVDDRQAHDAIVRALRSRTGLGPVARNRSGGYPGYPPADTRSAWALWLAARTRERKTEEKLAEQDRRLTKLEAARRKKEEKEEKEEKAEKAEKEGGEGAASDGTAAHAAGAKAKAGIADRAPADLGRPDRIEFKNGASLVCYILSKRVDADGVLRSVRIVHLDNGGQEILPADLIARIDEDIR